MKFTFQQYSPRRPLSILAQVTASILFAGSFVNAIQFDLESPDSIKQAAGQVAGNLWAYYNTTEIPGNLPAPYYWWEAGALMMTMIEYWYYTGDSQYNSGVTEALQFQVGPYANYMTPNQSRTTGNDDQAFWAFAAMDAAEMKYPNPPSDQPQWLALAQAVFNTQVARWDTETCGGGLRWQVFFTNKGYNYKNSISNGCFFALAARLALYTGNQTYADWAEKTWSWSTNIGLIDNQYNCYDGLDTVTNCSLSGLNRLPFSYASAVYLHGAANMWNLTSDAKWRTVVDGIIRSMSALYIKDGVLVEVACEPIGTCNNDQRSFKAYTMRWLAATTQLCAWTHNTILDIIQKSSTAAAQKGCAAGQCTLAWTDQGYDKWVGKYGPGENMAALSAIQSNLIPRVSGVVSTNQGGISQGDPGAGNGGDDQPPLPYENDHISGADRAGAGILTALIVVTTLGGGAWMAGAFME